MITPFAHPGSKRIVIGEAVEQLRGGGVSQRFLVT